MLSREGNTQDDRASEISIAAVHFGKWRGNDPASVESALVKGPKAFKLGTVSLLTARVEAFSGDQRNSLSQTENSCARSDRLFKQCISSAMNADKDLLEYEFYLAVSRSSIANVGSVLLFKEKRGIAAG